MVCPGLFSYAQRVPFVDKAGASIIWGFKIKDVKKIALKIVAAAKSKKAIKPVVLDMRQVSGFCDYFVIVSGTSLRHVNAIAKGIQEGLDKEGQKALSKLAGDDESGWIALDYVDVVAHIFYKPMREFYSLERLWSDAKKVRIPRKL
jgi:ribosome-associated protein